MPLYDYECEECSSRDTLLLTHEERRHAVGCAKCGAAEMKPMLSTFAVRSTSRFAPRSLAERLAGPGARGGSGTEASSVLGHSH